MSEPVFDLLTALAECLCAQIEEDGSPRTCFCGVTPGAVVAQNWSSNCSDANGMAWVRLVSEYPADAVGEANVLPGNCSSGRGLQVEVGMMRKMPVGNSYGEPPTPAEFLAATEQQIKDAATMRRAIACCPAFGSKDFILGSYSPAGPMGEMVGGTWSLALAL